MKSALMKEFYSWRNTRLVNLFLCIGISLINIFTLRNYIYADFSLYIMFGAIVRTFTDDEKSGWNNYVRTLPVTVEQKITARYIFAFAELLIGWLIALGSSLLIRLFAYEGLEFEEYLDVYTISFKDILASHIVYFAFAAVAVAVSLPLNYKTKGTLRTVISIIPMLIVIIPITMIYISQLLSSINARLDEEGNVGFYDLFAAEEWLPVAIIAVGLTALAASWFISVIIDTRNDKQTLKNYRTAAVALSLSAVIITAASIGLLVARERISFRAPEYSFDGIITAPGDYYDVVTDEDQQNRENIIKFAELFCGDSFVDKTPAECKEKLLTAGLIQSNKSSTGNSNVFTFEKGSTEVTVSTSSTDPDRMLSVVISGDIGTNYIEKATAQELDDITKLFQEGLTEKQLAELFKELEIYPLRIREMLDTTVTPPSPMKNFAAVLYIGEYNGGFGLTCELNIEVRQDEVIDVRIYKTSDAESDEPETAPEKSYDELSATREASRENVMNYIEGFCLNGYNSFMTAEQFAEKIALIDTTPSLVTDWTFTFNKGDSFVWITADKDTGIIERIGFDSQSGATYITEATSETLHEFTSNFEVGLTEKELILVFRELDFCPQTIDEEPISSIPQRIYEGEIYVAEYNGYSSVICTVRISVINGVVDEVSLSEEAAV